MQLSPSAHIDTFARDNLPAEELWPILDFTLPELNYPTRLNAATELLDRTIEHLGPDRLALCAPEYRDRNRSGPPGQNHQEAWTYGELQERVAQVAHLLTGEHHLLPGQRVLIRIPNNPWAVIVWLAVLKAGGIAITTLVGWRSAELSKIITRTKPRVAVVDHRYTEDLAVAAGSQLSQIIVGGPADSLIGPSGRQSTRFEAVQTSADDVALFSATSGTTGPPKITAHFHRDVLAIADTFAKYILGLSPEDVIAGSPPLAFTFSLGGLVIFPLRFGASTVLLERASPLALAEVIEQHNVSVLFTAPTGYRTLLREKRADTLRRLRIGVSAGEHLPQETFDAVEAASGLRLINGIGATEMLHVFISASSKDIVPGTTGKAVPGFRAKILDDSGEEVPPGTPGHLAVIGPTGCRYLDDTRQSTYVQNGWNITGDTCSCDENGYFRYYARSDDMIVTAGYNIGAPEVEEVIDAHPGVVESAVIGRPDCEKGAIIHAFVVLGPGIPADESTRDAIRETVRSRLAAYKSPRRIDFVETLPRNPSGKLQRAVLRKRSAEDFSASQAIDNTMRGA